MHARSEAPISNAVNHVESEEIASMSATRTSPRSTRSSARTSRCRFTPTNCDPDSRAEPQDGNDMIYFSHIAAGSQQMEDTRAAPLRRRHDEDADSLKDIWRPNLDISRRALESC